MKFGLYLKTKYVLIIVYCVNYDLGIVFGRIVEVDLLVLVGAPAVGTGEVG